MEKPFLDHLAAQTRRQFFEGAGLRMGGLALGLMLGQSAKGAQSPSTERVHPPLPGFPHFAPKAKSLIYLHMNGGPTQLDLWDYKPQLQKYFNQDLPASVKNGQRITTMTSGQARFPVAPSTFKFRQAGQCGRWISDALPYTAGIVDDIAVIKSVRTNAINHDPACTFVMTGSEVPGKASIGSWLSYGLGSENNDLPSFVVFTPRFPSTGNGQALFTRMWSSGFLPTRHNGVALRGTGDPVLYLQNPEGVTKSDRRSMLDALSKLPGTFTHSALMTRRLIERGVRVVQILHRGWDQHGNVPVTLKNQCLDTDRATAALVMDLKQRGLLDDTLVVWGGEFGRTVYSQGTLTATDYGRDHHPGNFCMWMAGGGVKPGITYGETDDFSYNVVDKPVHVNDLNATIMHSMGIDHERFTFKYQGLDQKLTGVEPSKVVTDLLA